MKQLYRRLSAEKVIKQFNAEVPIGTVVLLDNVEVKTWSHAALGPDGNAVVWLEGRDDFVPLGRLTVFVKEQGK
jgi:hypothetical protein